MIIKKCQSSGMNLIKLTNEELHDLKTLVMRGNDHDYGGYTYNICGVVREIKAIITVSPR